MKIILPTIILIILLAWIGPEFMGKVNDSFATQVASEQKAASEREKRRNKAAQAQCGNGAVSWLDETTFRCQSRKSREVAFK